MEKNDIPMNTGGHGRPRHSRLSLRVRLSLSFSLVGLIVLLAFSSIAYIAVRGRLYDDIRARLLDTVAVAALSMPADEHARILKAGDENTPAYIQVKRALQHIRQRITDVKFVYTMRLTPDKKLMFVGDAEDNPEEMSHPGDIYEDAGPDLIKNIQTITKALVEKEPYTDQWGTFLSAYAPVVTSTGTIDGVIGIDISVQSVNNSLRSFLILITGCVLILTLPIVGLGFYLGGVFARPIARMLEKTERVTAGDFGVDFDISGADEFVRLSQGMNGMVQSLKLALGEVIQAVSTLAESSGGLSTVAGEMSTQAGSSSARAETVAVAAAQMSSNIQAMAAGMQQAAGGLENLAVSTEQMSATIGDIAGNAEKARSISTDAVSYSSVVLEGIAQLSKAAQEIGKVTDTITGVSEQTSLLALNATIEAARAGASGKGFAVVAGEIKELAKQTAAATDDIKNKVEAIQSSTSTTIAGMEKITGVIKTVSEIVTTIASAIEEQDSVTRDFARNIAQATGAVRSANEQTAQSSVSVREITQDIVGVSQAARQITAASQTVEKNAADLSTLAGHLRGLVEKFKV